eukprot:2174879-Pyramimonas_sp.AAC.1
MPRTQAKTYDSNPTLSLVLMVAGWDADRHLGPNYCYRARVHMRPKRVSPLQRAPGPPRQDVRSDVSSRGNERPPWDHTNRKTENDAEGV